MYTRGKVESSPAESDNCHSCFSYRSVCRTHVTVSHLRFYYLYHTKVTSRCDVQQCLRRIRFDARGSLQAWTQTRERAACRVPERRKLFTMVTSIWRGANPCYFVPAHLCRGGGLFSRFECLVLTQGKEDGKKEEHRRPQRYLANVSQALADIFNLFLFLPTAHGGSRPVYSLKRWSLEGYACSQYCTVCRPKLTQIPSIAFSGKRQSRLACVDFWGGIDVWK